MQLIAGTPGPTGANRGPDAAPGGALRAALAAATAALLAPMPAPAQTQAAQATQAADAPSVEWKLDSAVLLYAEGGGRVRAVEPVVSARRVDGNEVAQGLKLTLDALTGASPNGAAPQPVPQTFTSPSGQKLYTVAPGAPPLDPSFHDARAALAYSVERPLAVDQRLSLGASVSAEYDFQSLGASAAWARDFDDKNTTLSLGAALERDRLRPAGGTPIGLRPAFGPLAARQGAPARSLVDLLVGVTQVMSRHWLMQFNLGLGRSSGYHSDPYKVLSVVDGTSGLVSGDGYVAEQRPQQRTRWSAYWQHKVHLERDIVDAAYRAYRDDWGVRAHTLDLRYRFELAGGLHLEPHARLYRQSAASFWRGWLIDGVQWDSAAHAAALAHASADPRLAAFRARTWGVAVGAPVGAASAWSVRLERYDQRQQRPQGAPGVLSVLDIAPGLRAAAVMVGFNSTL